MKILLIKTSSLGDLIHTFPAITDLQAQGPHNTIDWVVERNFAEVPKWHPGIREVIPVDLRRWFKRPLAPSTWREWRFFIDRLRRSQYDVVLDAQGLVKSALITRKARGLKCGLNWQSAWEPLASLVYERTCAVDPNLHAIDRMRALFALTFEYQPGSTAVNFGLNLTSGAPEILLPDNPYLVFAHATTWESKRYPKSYWRELIRLAQEQEIQVLLPFGNTEEQRVAQELSDGFTHAKVLDRMTLTNCAQLIAHAKAVVAVDTGLGHIASALGVPLVSLYGPTDPTQTGTFGENATMIQSKFACAPCEKSVCRYRGSSQVQPACFGELTPELVWRAVQSKIGAVRDDSNLCHHYHLQPA